jgi:BirA family transcriptional regulator, biotin operon repressor / biotin---[acetyl-CoA-carboxylase] ligase
MSALDAALIKTLRSTSVHLPGGELAALLRTDRETVVARVAELRDAGFEIDERPGLGYRLVASPDRLIADDLRARLGLSRFVRDLIVFGEVDSTNERAAQLGRGGALGGLVIFAERQTAGRGRFGRRWESAAHLGLWFSILLRPTLPQPLWPRLTTWAAAAVANGLQSALSVDLRIKWPNDLQIDGRKLSGILSETGVDHRGEPFAVVGIGVNVNHTEENFPNDLCARATSLRMVVGREVNRPALAVAVLHALATWAEKLEEEFEEIVAEATRRSSLLGRWIEVRAGDEVLAGVAEGLDAEGQLLLRSDDGRCHSLAAGEVTVLGARVAGGDGRLS